MKASVQEVSGGAATYHDIDPIFSLAEAIVPDQFKVEQQSDLTVDVYILLKDYLRHLKQNYYSGMPEEALAERINLFSDTVEHGLVELLMRKVSVPADIAT
jgi:hypothetical protein